MALQEAVSPKSKVTVVERNMSTVQIEELRCVNEEARIA